MRSIVLSGRVKEDVKYTQIDNGGSGFAEFVLANNDIDIDNAEFFNVICYDSVANFAHRFVSRGQRVVISGSFRNEVYTDKNGDKIEKFIVIAKNIEFGC